MQRFPLAILIALTAATAGWAGPPEDSASASLRTLGKIDATARVYQQGASSWITLTASDAASARACGSKLLADLLGFGDAKRVSAGALPGTRVDLPGVAAWLLALDGPRVQILFARDLAALPALATQAHAAGWAPVPEHAYPRFLDRFDNDSISVGFLGWGILPPDVNANFQWCADQGFAIAGSNFTAERMVAPDVFDYSIFDWYGAKAKQLDLAYNIYLEWTTPWQRPKWTWETLPLPYVIPGDHGVPYSDFGFQDRACYTVFAPVPAVDPILAVAQQGLSSHLAQDPQFNGQFAAAEIQGECLLSLSTVAGMPETRAAWHDYLRTKLGLDLAGVGRRYRDDPAAYTSWDQVEVPGMGVFAGWDPATCVNLRGEWESKPDRTHQGIAEKWYADPSAAGWTPTRSDDPLLLLYAGGNPRHDFWLRKHFTLAAGSDPTKLPYLHISLSNWKPGFDAYLNGHPLKDLTENRGMSSDNDQCFETAGALQPGDNSLVLNTHGEPVSSYIFLAPQGRWQYPSPDRARNRLYFDTTEFAAQYRMKSVENALRAFRAGDPQGRPQLIMCPDDYQDIELDLCQKYGGFSHDTGQTAGCWAPWPTRYAAIRGLPYSSEPGNAPHNAQEMQKMMTLYLLLGNHSDNLLFDPIQYRDVPDIAAWITANRDLMRCSGKMEMAAPPVTVLRSVRDAGRLGFDAPWGWDLSRGELQAVGRTCYLADLPDVASGLVARKTHVLIDAGTELLTDPEISALEKFVRGGGVFVALHNTGRHSLDQADSWPISRLTGLRVVNENRAIGGKIRFTDTQTLWPSLRGHEINAWGMVYDWQHSDLTGNSLGLEKQDPTVEVIAQWVDRAPGQGQIAVAARHLGSGLVLTLGSTFWRSAQDLGGRWTSDAHYRPYLAELLDSLGVTPDSSRESSAATADLFAEHWLSKNGLYDLYMVGKVNDNAAPATFPITFTAPGVPADLREISTLDHAPVAASPAPTGFTINNVTLGAMQTRIYAAPRADLARAPLYWLHSLEHLWYTLPPVAPVTPVPPSPYILPLVDGWTMQPGGDPWGDTPPAAFATASGATVKLGSFAALGLSDDSLAHFRRQVQLPARWQGRRLSLVLDCDEWIFGVQPHGRLWINGQPVTAAHLGSANDERFSCDLTAPADGRLAFALEVDGRQKPGAQRRRPTGILGTFYLQSDPQPVSATPLPAPWQLASDINVLTAATPGTHQKFLYAETTFTLPATWPTHHLHLESPDPLGYLILNNTVLSTPQYMRRMDISRLVHHDGTPNVLRWAPRAPGCDLFFTFTGPLPAFSLAWWPD